MTTEHRARLTALVVAGLLSGCAAAQNTQSQRLFPVEVVRTQCLPFQEFRTAPAGDGYRSCAVSSYADLGIVDGAAYAYAIYCLIPHWADTAAGTSCGSTSLNAERHRSSGVIVFRRDTGRADAEVAFERVSAEIGTYTYLTPAIERTSAGTLLYLPIRVDGTGNFNASEYYLRESGAWQRVESESWLAAVRSRLPDGLGIWKGVWPDPRTLQATASLYRTGDGNCCPTGGTAHIQLAIRDGRFVVVSVEWGRLE